MTHELRFLERLRRHAASLLHLLSAVGLYRRSSQSASELAPETVHAERETPRNQYALTLREPYSVVEARVHRLGFVRNLVSSLKFRDYAAPPETSVASWVRYPDGALASDRQLHLALFAGPDRDTTDVYAHWDPRGSVTRSDTIARPMSTPRRGSDACGSCSSVRRSSTR